MLTHQKIKGVCTPEEIRDKKIVSKGHEIVFFNVQKDLENKDGMEFLQ